ncbi:restriction endonuclease subunit S [Micromonospora sp. NPDC005223]|uniref:restriction endonuclease subunit S n=1 Tax=Micromonospora sp. NPDC005223 TaxID=3364227 RepID=UPI0036AE6AFF
MTDLPTGWSWVRLADVAAVQGGIQKQAKRRPVRNKYPFLRVANVLRGRLNLDDVHEVELFDGELERFELRKGDLLVVEGNGSPDQIGRAASWDGSIANCVHQNHLIRVRATAALVPEYLQLVWNSPLIARSLREVAGSTSGLYTLSTAKLKSVILPLPPLAEQHRVVAALEGYLARIATGESLLAAGSQRLVALASTGSRSMQRELSDAPDVCLGDLISEPLRNGHSARASDAGTVRTITLSAVTQGEFSDRFTKMTGADPARVRGLWLRSGDILIQRSNTPDLVGTSALYRGPEDWAIFPDLLIRVRVREDVIPEYVLLVLQSPESRRYFRSRAKGLAGSMPKIDQQAIHALPLKLPSIDQQAKVVRRARELATYIESLRVECVTAMGRSARLRGSLLAEAFAGRLVLQDPDDEPASELLARIQAERVAASPKGKTRVASTRTKLAAPPTRVTGDNYQQEALPL